MVTSVDSSLLLNYYASQNSGASGGFVTPTATKRVAPTSPWARIPTPEQAAAKSTANVKAALAGHPFVNENAAQLDLPGASDDYRKLFALYQGLSTLSDLAAQAQKKGVSSTEMGQLQKVFAKGLAEVTGYARDTDLDKLRLTTGDVATTVKTTAPVAATKSDYTTAPLYAGTSSDSVPAFQGNVAFRISVKRAGVTHDVDINLGDLDPQTRSMATVVNFINGKLAAEGVDTRIATQRLPGAPKTTTVNGKTVTLGTGPDQWALKVKPSGETVSFSATSTAPAVYLAQNAGNPDPDGKATTKDSIERQQFVKFQTDTTGGVDAPVQPPGQANWVDGEVFSKTLGPEVKTVRATQTAADGSVYMLADITGKTTGQAIAGTQDAALLKYDPAGNLVFSRTLGASDSASGLALAVSADGKVAIAGAVTGALNGSTDGALNSIGTFAGQSDSFVTVFNADGEEQYTQRRGARLADEASELAFGADGTVYVAGRSKSALPGSSNLGDYDGYIEAFSPPDAKGKVTTLFTQNFGTAASDRPAGLVVDGSSLVVASVESGRGVLRRYDVSGAAPSLTNTRDLGDLQGGDITGLALDGTDIVVAGSTSNGALNAGTVTKTIAGGTDAFAARLSASLTPTGSDAIAYYGGAGDDHATALAVSGGKVWITGSAGTDLPGAPTAVGKKDGFLAQLDIATGAPTWQRRFTGKDGFAAPTSLAVDAAGASSLDRLGLPKGTLDLADSKQITAASSLRAGEQFQVRVGDGPFQTITIDGKETLDTLSQKIKRATGFQAKVTIGSDGNGGRKLTIAPQNPRTVIEFAAGKTDKDALGLLGIQEGVVRATTVGPKGLLPADGKGQIYGLSLAGDLKLGTPVEMAHAAAEVGAAMGVIRKAYKDLVAAATPKSPAQASAASITGKVPAYLTNQIANYQAALDRLGG